MVHSTAVVSTTAWLEPAWRRVDVGDSRKIGLTGAGFAWSVPAQLMNLFGIQLWPGHTAMKRGAAGLCLDRIHVQSTAKARPNGTQEERT